MEFFSPASWPDALAVKAEHPQATPIAGGTDLMVELNFGRRRPEALLDLTRIPDLAGLVPALAKASRTVGSPQIRNRGTVGGNLGSASPAGDAHPPLLATGAEVEVASSG